MNDPQTPSWGTPSHWLAWLCGLALPSLGAGIMLIVEEAFPFGVVKDRVIGWILLASVALSPCVCLWAILSDPRTSVWMKVILVLMTLIVIVLVLFIIIIVAGIISLMLHGLEGTQ